MLFPFSFMMKEKKMIAEEIFAEKSFEIS